MSKRPSFGIFLFALALLARIFAPLAADARSFDPLSDAPICTHDGAAAPGGPRDAGTTDVHALCDLTCCQVLPLVLSPQSPTSIVRVAVATKSTLSASRREPLRLTRAHRARGPPVSA